jgi:uncharacterized membrane protein YczE
MDLIELGKARVWAIGMITASIILLVLMVIVFQTGWPNEFTFWIFSGASIPANFVYTLILFVLGTVLMVVGIALNVVCNSHSAFVQSFEERMRKTTKYMMEKQVEIDGQ